MADGRNFPEPKTNADRIALKAAELLDQDIWERVTDSSIWVRGIRIWWGDSGRVYVDIDSTQDATALKNEQVSSPIAGIFATAKDGAMARKRFTLLVPKFAQISNDAWERVIAAEARKLFWRQARKAGGWIAVGCIAVGAMVGGISSCAAEEARKAAQVNEYGYRYGDLGVHLQYPDDCKWQSATEGKGLVRCKEIFEGWESRGETWVDWEEVP